MDSPVDHLRSMSPQLPRFDAIEPQSRTTPFDGENWLFEIKYDGFPICRILLPASNKAFSIDTDSEVLGIATSNPNHFGRVTKEKTTLIGISVLCHDGKASHMQAGRANHFSMAACSIEDPIHPWMSMES